MAIYVWKYHALVYDNILFKKQKGRKEKLGFQEL